MDISNDRYPKSQLMYVTNLYSQMSILDLCVSHVGDEDYFINSIVGISQRGREKLFSVSPEVVSSQEFSAKCRAIYF